MDIRKRDLLKIVLPIAVMVFLTINIMDYRSTKKALQRDIENETESILNTFISEVELFTSRRTGDVLLMADYIPYIVEDEKAVIRFLERQHDVMKYFSALGFITPEGKIIADDGKELEVKKKESFLKALNGEIVTSDVFAFAQNPEINVTSIVVPVEDEKGKVIGVLSGLINLEEVIHDITHDFSLPGAIYFLKDKKIIYSYPKKPNLMESDFSHEEYIEEIITKKQGEIDLGATGHLLKYGTTESGWVIIADSIENPKMNGFSTAYWKMLLLSLLIVFVGILMYYYIHHLRMQAKGHIKKDLLTGLPNRLQLQEDIQLNQVLLQQTNLGIYVIRLDRFREFIERSGYQKADELLVDTTSMLREFNKYGRSYRVDFEVFVYVIECASERATIIEGEELVKHMNHGITVEGDARFNVTASVGGIWAETKITEEHLINSGYACQESGKAGGNQFKYYDEEMESHSKSHRQRVLLLSSALEKQEFYLVYQPIYSIQEQKVVGFEALLRWKSPELGEVGPFEFISILEEDQAIIETGLWIMYTVADQVTEWQRAGHKRFTVNVNVSVKQLYDENFLRDVQVMLKETKVDPSFLIFEVTESVMVDHVEVVVDILSTLNTWGIKTAVDDFGTGYSSLSTLTTLPFQYLKIDKAFIDDVERREPGTEAILKGIIDMAKALDQTTVLEGVETLEQLQLLKTFGAQRIQGYFISKPLRAENAILMLDKEIEWK